MSERDMLIDDAAVFLARSAGMNNLDYARDAIEAALRGPVAVGDGVLRVSLSLGCWRKRQSVRPTQRRRGR